MKRNSQKKKTKAVRASDLAQMGVCERLVVFEHRYGKRTTASRRAAIRRGLQEHDRFYRDGVRMAERKGRCCIATLVFGPGRETGALRMFRDRVLRESASGRWLIAVYYKTAPGGCAVLARWPWLQPLVRTSLRPMAWMASYMMRGNGGEHAA